MSDPRKHHYLPQFYLRAFSLDGESLYQIEKKTGRFYGCKIKDMAAIRDFHEIDGDDVKDPFALEKALAYEEAELSNGFNSLLEDGIKNENAISRSIALLSLLRMRVPSVKKHIEISLESTVRTVAESMEKNGKLPPIPAGYEESLKIENIDFEISNWKCMEIMFGMATHPSAMEILLNMRVTLLNSPIGTSFFTCDQPVALFYPEIAPSHGVGPATKEVQISLPLSRSTLLKLDHEDGADEERESTSQEVQEFNRRTMVMAEKYLFACSDEAEIASKAHRSANLNAGFRFSSLKAMHGTYKMHHFQAVGIDALPDVDG